MIEGGRCALRYPLVLVHGTGFRDHKRLNYWGRIPAALEREGAQVFYCHQDAWGTVEDNAEAVARRVCEVLTETGAEKVNLVAHSKGGLEARWALSELGLADKVASLTTLSTPHKGSETMERLSRLPDWCFRVIGVLVNGWYRLLGDRHPNFYHASRQFTTTWCQKLTSTAQGVPGVYCQSYAAAMKRSLSDVFLCVPHFVIKRVEGENDGMVTVSSARWCAFQGVLRGAGRRGISHADVVDLRRRDVDGFDVRAFYIGLVERLREKGL